MDAAGTALAKGPGMSQGNRNTMGPAGPATPTRAVAAGSLNSPPPADVTSPETAGDTPHRNGSSGHPQNFTGLILSKDFQLVRRLGEGGMGQVYLAEQLSLRRKVAVKLLKAELAQDEVSRKRFETEAKAVAQLSHANIVQVYAVGDQDGLLYMALEFVDGWTLKDYLTRKGPPELPVALSIMRQVAAALARAAEVGIIHRDIKPENILLTRKVEVKVTDFGLSRIIGQAGLNLTQTGTSMGTPLYMSPEQVMGVPLDPRTDLYSFGATCYHLLSGQPPFTGDSAMAVGIKHVQDEPVPLRQLRPDLPPELAGLVHRLLAKRPEDRYQTARELLRDLKRISEGILGGGGSSPSTTLPGSPASSAKLMPPGTPRSVSDVTEPYIVESGPHPSTTVRRAWLPWALGLSLLAAIALGALAGQLLKGPSEPDFVMPTLPSVATGSPSLASSASKPADRRDEPPFRRPNIGPFRNPPPRSGPDLVEKDLLESIERTARPGLPGNERAMEMAKEGTRARAELAYHYLLRREPHEVAKAEQFFKEQVKSPVPNYKDQAELVLAVILAEKGQNRESLEAFDRILKANDVPGRRQRMEFIIQAPDLFMAKVLYHAMVLNEKKEKVNWPPEVTKLYERLSKFLPQSEKREIRKE